MGARQCERCDAAMRDDSGILKCDYCHDVVVPAAGSVSVLDEHEGEACPMCAIELMQATIGTAALLYCTRCDGMLVAMEELDSLIAASRALPDGVMPAEAASVADLQPAIACPQCRRAMETRFYDGNVAIASCDGCGWNWLNHDELARIAHASAFSVASNSAGSYFNPSHAASSGEFNLGA
jgi:Zn-finger nucleic acid-binding protein